MSNLRTELEETIHNITERQLAEKDVEIDQLKRRNAQLEKLNLMTDEEIVIDLKAEIEQMHKENLALVSEQDSLNYEIIKKDAEIERLKAEVKDLLEQNAEWQKALVESVEKRDKLITELCDALEECEHFRPLIQRAREATQ
jgi:hypothetical protein